MEKAPISRANITKDVNAGMKREEIIAKYSTDAVKLTNSDVTKILKSLGLTIRKFSKPRYEIIDDQLIVLGVDEARAVKAEAEEGNNMPMREVTEAENNTNN